MLSLWCLRLLTVPVRMSRHPRAAAAVRQEMPPGPLLNLQHGPRTAVSRACER